MSVVADRTSRVANIEDLRWAVGARAMRKLDDADAAVRVMQTAPDFHTYRRSFGTALADIRSARLYLEKDATNAVRRRQQRHLRQEVTAWWSEVKAHAAADDLLSWAEAMRDDHVHGGRPEPILESVQYTSGSFRSEDLLPAPVLGAGLSVGLEGAEWVVNFGEVDEQRWPVQARPGTPTALAENRHLLSMSRVPTSHLGAALPATLNPQDFCQLVITFWREVVRDAMRRWGEAEQKPPAQPAGQ